MKNKITWNVVDNKPEIRASTSTNNKLCRLDGSSYTTMLYIVVNHIIDMVT